MYWRLDRATYEAHKGAKNRAAMRRLVEQGVKAGRAPGVIAYLDDTPVGWCAVAPREEYPRLERARVLRRIDAAPVWSIVCVFVAKAQRRRGISVALLEGAARWAASQGATLVEGYPVEPRTDPMPAPFVWTGTAAAFRAAGFVEAARGSPTRPIMRRKVQAGSAGEQTRPGRSGRERPGADRGRRERDRPDPAG